MVATMKTQPPAVDWRKPQRPRAMGLTLDDLRRGFSGRSIRDGLFLRIFHHDGDEWAALEVVRGLDSRVGHEAYTLYRLGRGLESPGLDALTWAERGQREGRKSVAERAKVPVLVGLRAADPGGRYAVVMGERRVLEESGCGGD